MTLLIWLWAAGETQEEREMMLRLEFGVSDSSGWVIEPSTTSVMISVEGTQRAIRKVERVKRLPVVVQPGAGLRTVELIDQIREHPVIVETGVTVVSTDPRTIDLELDEIVRAPARVMLGAVPGVDLAEKPTIDPAAVTIGVPRRELGGRSGLVVDAQLEPGALHGLASGVPHTLEHIALRPPVWLTPGTYCEIEPAEVSIRLTIRSQIREVAPPLPVRVQIAGSPEDEFIVELDPKQLRDVTVTVPDELAAQIESGEASLFAIVYLKTSEKELPIRKKPVTFCIALRPDGTSVLVDAKYGGRSQPPDIALTITEREGAMSEP